MSDGPLTDPEAFRRLQQRARDNSEPTTRKEMIKKYGRHEAFRRMRYSLFRCDEEEVDLEQQQEGGENREKPKP